MMQILSVLQAPWRPNQNFKIHFFFNQRCYFSVKDCFFFCFFFWQADFIPQLLSLYYYCHFLVYFSWLDFKLS